MSLMRVRRGNRGGASVLGDEAVDPEAYAYDTD